MDLDIGKHRLIQQQLIETKLKSANEMVAWLGAVQAQEYAQTKWALGLRLPSLTDVDIEEDFTEGRMLRTHLLRPTWHFVTPQDIRWMLSLTAPRVNAANAYMYRKLELDHKLFKRCNDILVKYLEGNNQQTRNEINGELAKKKIIAEGHRLSYMMMRAELDGIICSGARKGNQFTYCLLEERVPKFKQKSNDEALAELTNRYFKSRGPATINDFSTWSGLTLSDCKKGVAMMKSHLATKQVAKEIYYYSAEVSVGAHKDDHMYLLPIYDEYIMGYKDRSPILKFSDSISPAPRFLYDSTIVYAGQIIGTWKRTINAKSIQLEYDFFKPLNKKELKLFKEAIDRFQKFTALEVKY
jgi:hypothetical protein